MARISCAFSLESCPWLDPTVDDRTLDTGPPENGLPSAIVGALVDCSTQVKGVS
jgi:hypothetical protein